MDSKILYHYSGNIKCFNILSNRNIRLSDIRKSNDYAEMQIFYPDILEAVRNEYQQHPFDFEYEDKKGLEGISLLLSQTKKHLDISFSEGKITSYVLCLSEEGDLLSQWRGYADNGKGCSIGFDMDALKKFCDESDGIFRLEKIKYLTMQDIEALIIERATFLNKRLQARYLECKENSTNSPAKIFSGFFFDMIEEIGKSIVYKSIGFAEEKEWRLYINDWLYKSFIGYSVKDTRGKVAKYLEGKISYHYTDNDIISFTTFDFGDEPSKYVKRIILGPANKISNKDIENFLKQNNYATEVLTSEITYI